MYKRDKLLDTLKMDTINSALQSLKISRFDYFFINKEGKVYCDPSTTLKIPFLQKIFDYSLSFLSVKKTAINRCFYFFGFNGLENTNIFVVLEVLDTIYGYSFQNNDKSIEEFVNYIEIIKPAIHTYINHYKLNNNLTKSAPKYYGSLLFKKQKPETTYFEKIPIFLKEIQPTQYPIFRSDGKSIILSLKQSQIMLALVKGMSFADIEKKYGIRKKAAELYLANIKLKTKWQNRIQLIKAFVNMNPWLITEPSLTEEQDE